jgi:predicted O-linked N-acetylglucosamine transferase (SPINDLY family)
VYHLTGRIDEAIHCYQKTITLTPGNAEAHNNLGSVLKDRGDIHDSIRRYRQALEIKPDYVEAHSNLLFAMQYDPGSGNREIFTESQSWWRQHGAVYAGNFVHRNVPDPSRRLRVGYVSPDFREHSVSYFFLPLLEGHHPDAVETFCYADVKRPDAMTTRIKGLADHWRSIVGLGDEDVARKIVDDRIDILVDLAGHTANSRLLVFARKPAPVQVMWLGYPNTTGIPVMDYRITDDVADPVGKADRYHTERLVRLPQGFLCYAPPEEAGGISPLPALFQGRVTFGSFNNLPKVNEKVIKVWSRILTQAPGASLLIKSKPLRDEGVRRRYLEMFSECGVSADRIECASYIRTKQEHLTLYNRVDIGLDPFPYNGTTTTCEALWMGVPVVTLKGSRHSTRVGASILTRVGLEELICATEEDYVNSAVELAADLNRLSDLRVGMRDRLGKSPLCNRTLFAAGLEKAFRHGWRDWCQSLGSLNKTSHTLGRTDTLTPDRGNADALYEEGFSLQLKGRLKEAVECYRDALEMEPGHARVCNNMGVAFLDLGDPAAASPYLQRAIALNPDYVEAYINLGNVFQHQEELDKAISSYKKALEISPDLSEAHNNLGNVLMQKGKAAEAISSYGMAVRCGPQNAEAHCNMGNALQGLGRFNDAIGWYKKAIQIRPHHAASHNNMGAALKALGRLEEAVFCHQKALRLDPENAEVHNNLGRVSKAQGNVREAIQCYRKALEIRPAYVESHSNLLFAMQYDPDIGSMEIFSESQAWWRQHGAPHAGKFVHRNHLDPSRRLRVGYVSPDFREHSVSYFFLPLLEGHHPDAVETFCYADVKRPDSMTTRIKELADHWVSIVGLTDDAVARRIYNDQIDILVDLAGHTANNRLLVFARKPAPVQATWLGYPNTTGMPVMDYRLTDDIADPVGEADRYCTEQLVRLPQGFLCYAPPDGARDISPLPALREGRVTFGSFNNLPKVNEKVVVIWSHILRRVSESSLLLKSKSLIDKSSRRRYLELFSTYGISAERIQFEPYTRTTQEHLSRYNRMDIGLDPFPYNGTTTTCEALWMGVPVITLKGNRHSARVGASILTRVGLKELISTTEEDYIKSAVALAADLERLKELRARMRARLIGSPLCDASSFAGVVEESYQTMWKAQCHQWGR